MTYFKEMVWIEGQSVQARIEELIDNDFFIVSVRGRLFRVRNESSRFFKTGEEIHLIVQQERPLEFQLDPRVYNKGSFERFA